VTSLWRPTGAPPPDQCADGAVRGRGMPVHRPLDGQAGVPAETAPTTDLHADPAAVSVADFAAQLRELRERAGRPSYRRMAQLAHYSHTSLSQAAAGSSQPSLAVTRAFVRACDGDVEEWSTRWRQVDRVVRSPLKQTCQSATGPARPGPAWRAIAGWLRGRRAIEAAAVMAASACLAAAVLSHGNTTATGLRGQALARMQVEGSGLYVGYAVVTNLGTRTGYAYILNTGAGKIHRSPQPVRPGQSWTYFFNRELKDGARICGSIDLGPATCADVHA
jgi:Helix-turn-helix domain